MAEPKHTFGPWYFDNDWHRLPTIFAADRITKIAIIEKAERDKPTPEQKADARLIAAAPDLLAALKAADQFITNGVEFGYIRMPDPGTPDPAHETPGIIRTAIAKAEPAAGGSNG